MAFFKISFMFRAPDQGWSENFYDTHNDLTAAINYYQTRLNTDIFNRVVRWRGMGVTLQTVRIAEEGGIRRAHPLPANLAAAHTTGAAKDKANSSCKASLGFAGGGTRVLEVRGVADADIVGNATGESLFQGTGRTGYDEYLAWIRASASPFLGKRLANIEDEPWKTVVRLEAHATNPNWTRVTIVGADPLPALGGQVYLRGYHKATQAWLNGYFRVVDRNEQAFWFAIPTTYMAQVAQLNPRNMQWRRAIYDYPAIIAAGFLYASSRDTAGPFGRRRGRRSSLSLRQ